MTRRVLVVALAAAAVSVGLRRIMDEERVVLVEDGGQNAESGSRPEDLSPRERLHMEIKLVERDREPEVSREFYALRRERDYPTLKQLHRQQKQARRGKRVGR